MSQGTHQFLALPVLQAIRPDWVDKFNSGAKCEEVHCGPESVPAVICNKSDELICNLADSPCVSVSTGF